MISVSQAHTESPNKKSGTGSALARVLFVAIIAVIAPMPIMAALGYGSTGSFVGLAGIGVVITALSLGIRGGLIASLALGVGAILLTLTSSTWWAAGAVMAAIAFLFGLSARKGWQGSFLGVVIALSYVASDGANSLNSVEQTAIVLGGAFLVWGIAMTGLTRLFFKNPLFTSPHPETPTIVAGYVIMLTLVTFTTQSLAIALNMGHTGGWLVMTPFIVILPHIRDAFGKSLRRAGGTIVGFALVIGITAIITSDVVLYALAIALFTAAIFAKVKKLNYFIFAALLTPGIVLLEGTSTSVTQTDVYRLEATLAAVAISLVAMGFTWLLGRINSQRAETRPPA